MKLSEKSKKTYNGLVNKSKDSSYRMPSIIAISKLLNEIGISHNLRSSHNTVEYGRKSSSYVTSRRKGKKGNRLTIERGSNKSGKYLDMDTSDSYYSLNSYFYASDLLEIINKQCN